jgi:phage-related protein
MDALKLRAELGLDSESYEEGLSKAKDSADDAGGVIGGIFDGIANVAKVSAAAIAGVSAAIGGIAVQATKAYADYEQLVGGVETLFGAGGQSMAEYAAAQGKTIQEIQGEYTDLMKAQDTVIANASEAYRTAGMSANEYMETVTSFSASLLQSLDGDTQAAADAADIAIQDMADNANKMGTSMESIQTAYQGFAKQNYTMLDNLKLGYGGTKEEMERLLKDAEKLSGQKYDISNLSDVYEAIHVVQTEMGITGTTAKEAASTISGSLAMTKSAWENLVTAMAGGGDLTEAMDNLKESAEAFLGNAIPVFTQAISGIATVIQDMAPMIAEVLPDVINSVIPPLLAAASDVVTALASALPGLINTVLPSMLDGVMEVMGALAAALPDLINGLLDILKGDGLYELMYAGRDLIGGLVTGFVEAAPTFLPLIADTVLSLWETIWDIGMDAIQALPDLLNQIVDMIPVLFDSIMGMIPYVLPELIKAATSLITGLVNALPTIIDKLLSALPGMITTVINAIVDAIPLFVNAAVEIVNALAMALPDVIEALVDALPETLDAIIEGILALIEAIIDNLPTLIDAILVALPAIIDAIVEGLIDSVDLIVDAGFQLMFGLIDAIPMIIDALVPLIPDIISAIVVTLWNEAPKILGAASDLFMNLVTGLLSVFGDLNSALGEAVTNVLKFFIEPVANLFTGLWDGIVDTFKGIGSWFSGIFSEAWTAITEVFNFDTVTEFFVGVWDTITEAWDGLATSLGGIFKTAWNNIKHAFSTAESWFKKLGTTISDAISGAIKAGINALFDLMEKVLNGAIDLINGIIKGINKIPGVDIKKIEHVDLPELARGGIVDDPTVALIGEAGKEAIVPLENNTEWITKVANQLATAIGRPAYGSDDEYFGGGFVQNLTINAPQQLDPSEVERLTRMANQDMILAMGR